MFTTSICHDNMSSCNYQSSLKIRTIKTGIDDIELFSIGWDNLVVDVHRAADLWG